MVLLDNALTARDYVKLELGIDVGDTSRDERIDYLINSVSAMIEKYTGRRFGRVESVSEDTFSHDMSNAFVGITPLVSVDSVQYITLDGFLSDLEYSISNKKSGSILVLRGSIRAYSISNDITGYMPENSGRNNLKIVYSGGYNLPNDISPNVAFENLPFDIIDAATKEVASLFQGSGRDFGVTEESLSDHSVKYGTVTQVSEYTAKALLPYKRIVGV